MVEGFVSSYKGTCRIIKIKGPGGKWSFRADVGASRPAHNRDSDRRQIMLHLRRLGPG